MRRVKLEFVVAMGGGKLEFIVTIRKAEGNRGRGRPRALFWIT